MRTIVVMRHADAEQVADSDADRELTDLGREQAAQAGAWLGRDAGLPSLPQLVVVSAATRAIQTMEAVLGALAEQGWTPEVDRDRSFYTGAEDSVLARLREVPDPVTAVMVVGHNPTMASVAALLDDGCCDDDAGNALAMSGFPPGSVAVFAYDGDWADLDEGSARLTGFRPTR